MRQRIQVLSCLFAWFIATGTQWDLAQLVAWTRMFTGYSQEMSLRSAAKKTLSGEMCHLCKAVQKGKQEQEQNSSSSVPGKSGIKLLDAVPLTALAKVTAPVRRAIGLAGSPEALASCERMTPPLPPPRSVA